MSQENRSKDKKLIDSLENKSPQFYMENSAKNIQDHVPEKDKNYQPTTPTEIQKNVGDDKNTKEEG